MTGPVRALAALRLLYVSLSFTMNSGLRRRRRALPAHDRSLDICDELLIQGTRGDPPLDENGGVSLTQCEMEFSPFGVDNSIFAVRMELRSRDCYVFRQPRAACCSVCAEQGSPFRFGAPSQRRPIWTSGEWRVLILF